MKTTLRVLFFTTLLCAATSFASEAKITVEVNGKPVKFPQAQPTTFTGRTFVPLRGVFEAIGAYVEYNPVLKRITASMGNEEVELHVGERLARKNGADILMDVAPKVYKGSAMVPLRFLAEALGAKVDYDKAARKVSITVDQPTEDDEPPLL